jgi:transcriptional accessory protein Tex/SPT6
MSQDNPLVKAVYEILRFIRHENLEIPFIAVHRKDYYSPTLSASDLWRVYELDEKFLQIEVKKRALRQTFEDLGAVSEDARMDDYAALHIDKAQNLDDVADMQNYLQLHYALQQAMLDQAKPRMFKKPVWRVAYEGAKRNGLDAFGKVSSFTFFHC